MMCVLPKWSPGSSIAFLLHCEVVPLNRQMTNWARFERLAPACRHGTSSTEPSAHLQRRWRDLLTGIADWIDNIQAEGEEE